MQHLSGIATHTHRVVQQAEGLHVFDTRKTTPGLRLLEKQAVRIGGGFSHRLCLGDMILVKDNHIDANGGSVAETLTPLFREQRGNMLVEVEVRDREELAAALQFPIDIVMLDNMDDAQIEACVSLVREVRPQVLIEVSGGIRPERFESLRKRGVKRLSMGSLITQARSVDIALYLEEVQG